MSKKLFGAKLLKNCRKVEVVYYNKGHYFSHEKSYFSSILECMKRFGVCR